MPVGSRGAPETAQVHPQEVVDLADAVRLEDVHQLHLLVRAQASVSLRSEPESLRHAVASATKATRDARRAGALEVATAHYPGERGIGRGGIVPDPMRRVHPVECIW